MQVAAHRDQLGAKRFGGGEKVVHSADCMDLG
jgi:hypothetical protein